MKPKILILTGLLIIALALIAMAFRGPQDTATTVDTTDWVTYRNEELGFELKHPEGWVVGVDSNESILGELIKVNFTDSKGGTWGIGKYVESGDAEDFVLKETGWIKEQFDKSKYNVEVKKVYFRGFEGVLYDLSIEVDGVLHKSHNYILNHENAVWVIPDREDAIIKGVIDNIELY